MPGGEDTYQSYGTAWANLSNTPFRLYKHWIHEGGIATPFIVHWPRGIKDRGGLRHNPSQLPDIMATILDVTGATTPRNSTATPSCPAKAKAWCHRSRRRMAAVGRCSGSTKATPPSVSVNGSWCASFPAPGSSTTWKPTAPRCTISPHSIRIRVRDMSDQYQVWAKRCGVIPREKILELMKAEGGTAFWEEEKQA